LIKKSDLITCKKKKGIEKDDDILDKNEYFYTQFSYDRVIVSKVK